MAEPGPRMISMRSISSSVTGTDSHTTEPMKSRYTLRPSTSTSTLLERRRLKPRMETSACPAVRAMTSMPGASASTSGSEEAPLRRMSSEVMTVIALGDSTGSWPKLLAVTTSRAKRSSTRAPSSPSEGGGSPGSPSIGSVGSMGSPEVTAASRWARRSARAASSSAWRCSSASSSMVATPPPVGATGFSSGALWASSRACRVRTLPSTSTRSTGSVSR